MNNNIYKVSIYFEKSLVSREKIIGKVFLALAMTFAVVFVRCCNRPYCALIGCICIL